MKVTVKEVFIDKYTNDVYAIGQTIEINDNERISDLSDRGLIEKVETSVTEDKPKKSTRKTTK